MEYVSEKMYQTTDDLSDGFLKGEYDSCQFNHCDFKELNISEYRFLDCTFMGCDLSNIHIHKCSFQNVKFVNCKLMGLHFDTLESLNLSMHFENCVLSHSIFHKMQLNRCSFKDCKLHQVDFEEAQLKKVDLLNCDLLGANFIKTNLAQADLTDSINFSIDPELNRIQGASFSIPEVFNLLNKYQLKIK